MTGGFRKFDFLNIEKENKHYSIAYTMTIVM